MNESESSDPFEHIMKISSSAPESLASQNAEGNPKEESPVGGNTEVVPRNASADPSVHIMNIPFSVPNSSAGGNTEGVLINEPAAASPGSDSNPPSGGLTLKNFFIESAPVLWEVTGEYVHGALDLAGGIPVAGALFDGANGAIYAAEGNYKEAAMSFGSVALDLAPGVGTSAKIAKYSAKGAAAVSKALTKVTKTVSKQAEKIGLKQAEKGTVKTAEKGAIDGAGKYSPKHEGKPAPKPEEKKVASKPDEKPGNTQSKTEKKEDGIQTKEKKEQKKHAPKECPKAGHPVNPVLGIKFLNGLPEQDFILPAVIPLAWQRSYFSDQPGNGWLGQGWSLPFSARLLRAGKQLTFINAQGQAIILPALEIGQRRLNRTEQLCFERGENGRYYVSTRDARLRYTFAPLALDEKDRRGDRAAYLPLIAVSDANSNHLRLIYDEDGLPAALFDSAGRELNLHFIRLILPEGEPVRRLQRVSLSGEAAGKRQRETLVTYQYTAQGDLACVLDGKGKVTRRYQYRNHLLTGHSQPGGLSARYEYDHYTPQGRVIRHTTNLGQTWLFDYGAGETRVTDPLKRVTRYQFDDDKNFTALIQADGSTITRKLDDKGRLIALISPGGRETRWSYDHLGRTDTMTNAAGHRSTFRYDADNRLTAVTDAMGHTMRYDYDGAGNLLSETDALGQTTAYQYDARGLLTAVTGADGKTRRMCYDRMGMLASHTDCSGQTTRLARDSRGNINAVTHPDNTRTLLTYTERGEVLSVTGPDGNRIHYTYDDWGRLTTQRDALGAQTHWQRDTDGLILVRTDACGHTFHCHYDAARRLMRLTNENGAEHLFTYDDNDNVISEKGFDGVLKQYHYDGDGLLVETRVADICVTMSRDASGRMTEKTVRQGDAVAHSHFSYDAGGKLLKASNAGSTVTFTYDPLGRVKSETSEVLGYRQTLRHRYHRGGWRRQTWLPDGATLNYLCYGAGHFYQLNLDNEMVCETERDIRYRETSRTQGSITSGFNYDPSGKRLKQKVDTEGTSVSHFMSRAYEYDRVGNLTSVLTPSGMNQHYSYDPLGRLISANEACFSYDPAHNIVDSDGERVLNNRLSDYQHAHFVYDDCGRLREKTSEGGGFLRLYWTPENLLECVEAQRDGIKQTVQYGYDALGRRVYKKGAAGTTLFFWDGNRLLNEQHAGETITWLYGPSGHTPLAQRIQKEGDKHRINYYHTDPTGTPYAMTSQDGRLIWKAENEAWGKRRKTRSADEEMAHQPLCFPGQYYDEESGLHYNHHRYYDPDTGRFISPDPLGLMGGGNVYQYAPNPTGWIDPLGLTKEHTGIVYRALSDEEFLDAVEGRNIRARDPHANATPQFHVEGPPSPGGTHHGNTNLRTQYISTSRSLHQALCYAEGHMENVIEIDLSKVRDRYITDVSSGQGLHGDAHSWAREDQEVLIRRRIPAGSYQFLA
ncbi:RHS repeat-associated core domain-containing protein [Izhakiella capsodis]|uniref:RHS repeat-associated core domain-containing protein n=1 Tax=Izhakiella capsodis TaxID=1367852 RepID=A0A1I4XEI5_9GAMM|nr:RHS repeat-associated core domain-containing protein [Izhakiella capsodis]SFN24317.1 RHS repeat-associated core domain-containing protein [Izhakiella capsodis]